MGVIASTLAKIGTRKIVALVLTSEVIVTVWKEIAAGESETTLLNERATDHAQNIDTICEVCTDDHFGQLTEESLSPLYGHHRSKTLFRVRSGGPGERFLDVKLEILRFGSRRHARLQRITCSCLGTLLVRKISNSTQISTTACHSVISLATFDSWKMKLNKTPAKLSPTIWTTNSWLSFFDSQLQHDDSKMLRGPEVIICITKLWTLLLES